MHHIPSPCRVAPYLFVFLFLQFVPNSYADAGDHYIALYGGQYTHTSFIDTIMLKSDTWESYIGAIAFGKKFKPRLDNRFRFEAELQVARHEGLRYFDDPDPASGDPGWNWAEGYSHESLNSGHHTYEEFNAVIVARWLAFPWDDIIDTSIAFGEGISYATKNPPVEIDQHDQFHGRDYPVSKWLNYLLLEYTFSLPKVLPNWSVFYRIHHRSGIYGTINHYQRGSNFVTFGFRYDY